MEYLIWCVAILCFIVGIAGSLIPAVPGCLFVAAGCVVRGVFGPVHVGWYAWVTVGVLFFLALAVDKILGGMGAKRFGGSNWGVVGAVVGALAGSLLFTPLVGMTAGPFIGAFAAEFLGARKRWRASLVAGTGATLGMIAGMAAGVMLNIAMVAVFLFFYWRAS